MRCCRRCLRISIWPPRLRRSSSLDARRRCCWRSSVASRLRSSASSPDSPITWRIVRRATSSRRNIHDSRPRLSACASSPPGGVASPLCIWRSMIERQRCARSVVDRGGRSDRAGRATPEMRWFHSVVRRRRSARALTMRWKRELVASSQQVAELEPGAEHPETGIRRCRAARTPPRPIQFGATNMPNGPGVEGRRDVVEEAGLRRHRYAILRAL